MDHSAATPEPRKRGISLTTQIFIGLGIGVILGAIVDATNPAWAVYFRPFSQLFLRMIKMIIAPLIFATLVAGIAGAGHFKIVGRMGLRGDHLLRDRHHPGTPDRPRGGVPRRIVSFVLPLGYSFNLDGTTLYLSLAAVFVAQAAGVELTAGQQFTMVLTLMLTSKGVAGVPRASLVSSPRPWRISAFHSRA
jgi:Na+/H+-dicarboxylate symporter